eukprot:COSAG06_NODE_2534_length_6710_cov_23.487521_6_plen_87_part_00
MRPSPLQRKHAAIMVSFVEFFLHVKKDGLISQDRLGTKQQGRKIDSSLIAPPGVSRVIAPSVHLIGHLRMKSSTVVRATLMSTAGL